MSRIAGVSRWNVNANPCEWKIRCCGSSRVGREEFSRSFELIESVSTEMAEKRNFWASSLINLNSSWRKEKFAHKCSRWAHFPSSEKLIDYQQYRPQVFVIPKKLDLVGHYNSINLKHIPDRDRILNNRYLRYERRKKRDTRKKIYGKTPQAERKSIKPSITHFMFSERFMPRH